MKRLLLRFTSSVVCLIIVCSQANPVFGQSQFFSDLIISQYLDWHTGSSVSIVLYNPTKDSIDLSGYSIVEISQGSMLNTTPSIIAGLPVFNLPPGGSYTLGDGILCSPGTGCHCDLVVNFNGVNGNDIIGIIKGPWSGFSTSNWVDMIGVPGVWFTPSNTSQTVDGVTNGLYKYNLVRRDTHCIRYNEIDTIYDTDEADRTTSWPANTTTNVVGWEVLGDQSSSLCNNDSTLPVPNFQQWISQNVVTLCPGDTLTLGTQLITSPGTYADTFASARSHTCDSIVCIIAEAGISDTILIDTTVTFLYTSPNNNTYTSSDTFIEFLSAASGCDTVLIVQLDVLSDNATVITDSICPGDSVSINGTFYSTAGNILDTIVGPPDSILLIIVSIREVPVTNIAQNICPGDSAVVNGIVYSSAGIFTDTIAGGASNGCDSLLNITISATPNIDVVLNLSICPGQSITINGNVYDTAGTYFDTIFDGAFNGCDSNIVLNLSNSAVIRDTFSVEICFTDSFTYNPTGISYSNPGIFLLDTITGSSGCDSLPYLELDILPSVSLIPQGAIQYECNDQVPADLFPGSGKQYNTSGTFSDTIFNYLGCDSVIELKDLVILETINDTIIEFQDFCSGASIDTFGQTITESGVYRVLNQQWLHSEPSSTPCDSLHLYFIARFDSLPIITSPIDSVYRYCLNSFPGTQAESISGYNVNFTIPVEGTQIIQAPPQMDANGCWQRFNVHVNALETPTVRIIAPTTDPVAEVYKDTIVTIVAEGLPDNPALYSYQWTVPGETLPPGPNDRLIRAISDTVSYFVRYFTRDFEDIAGCVVEDQITFRPYEFEPFVIPNVFTPNNDGTNDNFGIYGVLNVEVVTLKIFNRWGEQVYEGAGDEVLVELASNELPSGATKGWDGRHQTKDQPAGTYVYLADIRFVGRQYTVTGTVTLVR